MKKLSRETVCVFILAIFNFYVVAGGIATAADIPFEECINCHSVLEKTFVHVGATFGCETCHISHDSDGTHGSPSSKPRSSLNEKMNQLCFQCHNEKDLLPDDCGPSRGGRCGHPVTGHPVRGPRDPFMKGKEFTCVSCHNPHSSNNKNLFRYAYAKSLCMTCHPK